MCGYSTIMKMHKTLLFLAYLVLSDANNGSDLNSNLNQGVEKPDSSTGKTGIGLPTPASPTPCWTTDNEAGECVVYYLCNENYTRKTDEFGLIDIAFHEFPCESYLDICCPISEKRNLDSAITPNPLPQHQGCGWRNPNGVGFRINGDFKNKSKFGEFPWVVAILRLEPVSPEDPNSEMLNIYVAGGSLIHPSVVLTVAHYVDRPQRLKARAGEWDTQTVKEIYPFQDRDVSQVVVHKDFNKRNLVYDVALLFLSSPMSLAPNVGVACLLERGREVTRRNECFTSGWGRAQYGAKGRYQVILKKVELFVMDRDTCEKRLRNTRLGSLFKLHSSFMCAGGVNGQDTCDGDGGSPLICPSEYEEGRYEQAGIVSWGIGCGADGTPGVYSDVARLRDWIDDQVRGHGYDTRVYTL